MFTKLSKYNGTIKIPFQSNNYNTDINFNDSNRQPINDIIASRNNTNTTIITSNISMNLDSEMKLNNISISELESKEGSLYDYEYRDGASYLDKKKGKDRSEISFTGSSVIDLSSVYTNRAANNDVVRIVFDALVTLSNPYFMIGEKDTSYNITNNDVNTINNLEPFALFSLIDKKSTAPIYSLIVGDKERYLNNVKKYYNTDNLIIDVFSPTEDSKSNKVNGWDLSIPGNYYSSKFNLQIILEQYKGNGLYVRVNTIDYRDKDNNLDLGLGYDVDNKSKFKLYPYNINSDNTVIALNTLVTDNKKTTDLNFQRYNLEPMRGASFFKNGFINIEYGEIVNKFNDVIAENYKDINCTVTFKQSEASKYNLVNGSVNVFFYPFDGHDMFSSVTVIEKEVYKGKIDPSNIKGNGIQRISDYLVLDELNEKFKDHCHHCSGIKYEDMQLFVEISENNLYPVNYISDSNGNIKIEDNKYYADLPVYVGSNKQFLYHKYFINFNSNILELEEEFKTGWDPKRYLVFRNGLLLNNSIYKIDVATFTNKIKNKKLYTAVTFRPGDRIEVFYIESDDNFLHVPYNHDVYMSSNLVYADENEQYVVNVPYPYKSYPKGDKYFFVFNKDGIYLDKKNDYTTSEDGSAITLFDHSKLYKTEDRNDYLVFVFPYVRAEFEEEGELLENKYMGNTGINFVYSYSKSSGDDGIVSFDPPFTSYELSKNNFLLFGNTTYISKDRFDLIDNHTIRFNNGVDIRHAKYANYTMIIFNDMKNSKFNMNSDSNFELDIQQIPAEYDGQTVFKLNKFIGPKSSFIVFVGSVSLEQSQKYSYNAANNSISFGDPNLYFTKGRNITVISIKNKGSEGGYTERIDFEKNELPIVINNRVTIPSSYFANNIITKENTIIFINGTYINPNRYKIDGNTIISTYRAESEFKVGKTITILYLYKHKVSLNNYGIEGPYEYIDKKFDHDDIMFDEMYSTPIPTDKIKDVSIDAIYGNLTYVKDYNHWYSRTMISGTLYNRVEYTVQQDFLTGYLYTDYTDRQDTDIISGMVEDYYVDWEKVSPNNNTDIDFLHEDMPGLKYALIANNATSISIRLQPNNTFSSFFTDKRGVIGIRFEEESNINIILPYTFKGMSDLKYVDFSKHLNKINSYAFVSCARLKNIILKGTNLEVDENAFGLLNNIFIPDTAKVADNAFEPNSIINITFDKTSNQYIMENTQVNRNSIETVSFESNKTRVQSYQFYGFNKLNNVVIPDTITEIYPAAFKNCTSLSSLTLNNNISYIGSGAFSNTKIKEVSIPNSCGIIHKNSFSDNTELTKVTIPNSIDIIEEEAFNNCSKLKEVIIDEPVEPELGQQGKGLKRIGAYAIGSDVLKEITLPASVKHIDQNAFTNCPELRTIYIKEYPHSHTVELVNTESMNNKPWGAAGATVKIIQ